MKKILLLISFAIASLAIVYAAEGELNAYAYGASYTYYTETNKIEVRWSMQATASAVRIVAVDEEGRRYTLKTYGKMGAGAHSEVIDLWEVMIGGLLPANENLGIEIDVKTDNRSGYALIKKITHKWPFSIDIDNNPYSKYFGLAYVTQMNSNASRGICVFDQWMAYQSHLGVQIDSDISITSGNWFDDTHGVPHMVRVLQDGTGRLLVSSSDRSHEVLLWSINPNINNDPNDPYPRLKEWVPIITSTQMKSAGWTNHGATSKNDFFCNAGLDVRENGDNWDILLYNATANSKTTEHGAGQAYSGVYRVPKANTDLTGGSYISYTAPTPNSSYDSGFLTHSTISNSYTASMLNAHANFDKFGGVLYNASSEQDNTSKSALRHRTLAGNFKTDYADGDYLKRSKLRTKGVRFSPDFTKLAVANGRLDSELRIYDVSQIDGNSHPVLSNGKSVNIVTGSSGENSSVYVHDMAWDYAKNLYVCVRNYSGMYGIYAVASNLNGEAITTPVVGQPFQVNCPDAKFTISLKQTGGTGTLTGAGTYASCTAVTVTAVPDNQYKFIRWVEGGQEVSREQSYTFYVTKNRELTAVFEPAVYNNITWWNLFEDGEDITTESKNLSGTNERLWRWLQIEYNYYLKNTLKKGEQRGPNQNNVGITNNQWMVISFFSNGNNSMYNSTTKTPTADETRGALQTLLDDSNVNSKFYWLGQYLENIGTKISITNTSSYFMWGWYLQAFINRIDYFSNSSGANAGTTLNGYSAKKFSTYGHYDYWRPYWTESVCNLAQTMTYNDAMPVGWTKPSCAPGTIVTWDSNWKPNITIAENPADTWYKWNNVDSEQNAGTSDTHILAWRKGSVKGPIITRVEEDGLQLYATYVKKHIHENDPPADLAGDYPQDATNSEVFRLLFNKHWESNQYAHKVTITRKIQGGMFNTICFPFTVYLGKDGSMPDGNQFKNAEYWKYTGNTNSTYNESGEPVTGLEFVQETYALQAGVPYLIYSYSDITQEEVLFGNDNSPSHKSVLLDTVPKSVQATPKSLVPINFVGTVNPKDDVPAGALILVADNRLAQTTEPGRIEGMRGYFTIDPMWASDIAEQAADGRVYLSMKKPVTTSIPVAPEAEQQTKPEVRKVMYDGQIYFLRGDEVYTITGHRVK